MTIKEQSGGEFVSKHDTETNDDQTDESASKPDLKFDITNGKHVEVDFSVREWAVISVFILTMTIVLGHYGVF